jgi:four helix bundle protein
MKDDKTSEKMEKTKEKTVDIRERAFAFAVRIIKLSKFLEKSSDVSRTLINQLLDAGTSIGANLQEAVAGQSKADFVHKNSISLKEARESNYWLRLILATSLFDQAIAEGIKELETESSEIANIIGSIIVKTKA